VVLKMSNEVSYGVTNQYTAEDFGRRNKQPTILSVIDYPQLHEFHGVSLVLNDLLNSHFLQKKDGSVITLVNPFRMPSVP
jgi:hypothetical protein